MTGQRSIRVLWTVLFLLGSLGAGGADAQRSKSGPACSLEWLACRSDLIVCARIDDATAGGHAPWACMSARVVERLKGELPDRFEFAIQWNNADPRFGTSYIAPKPEWISRLRGREALLFLLARESNDRGPSPPSPLVVDLSTKDWSIVVLDGDDSDFAATMDFSTIKDRKEILKMTRTAVSFSAERPKSKTYRSLGLPGGTELSKKAWGATNAGILLPDDERLEKKAIEWTESDNPWVKLEGIRVLGRKRTPKNVEILESLSRDPTILGGRTVVADLARAVLERWKEAA